MRTGKGRPSSRLTGASFRSAEAKLTKIDIKRVYEPPSSADGLRILVDRLWPRGLRKEAAAIDQWGKELAPSTELRKWFDHRPDRFTEFGRLYREELAINPAVAGTLAYIGDERATLLYAARDPAVNHAVILAEYLKRATSDPPPRNGDR